MKGTRNVIMFKMITEAKEGIETIVNEGIETKEQEDNMNRK